MTRATAVAGVLATIAVASVIGSLRCHLVCVTVLLASGAAPSVLAKVVLVIALVVLGWRNRTVWLPAARTHRASAARSQRRSVAELALMVAALTMAAALAVTG